MSSAQSPKIMDIVLVVLEGDVDPGTEFHITPDEPVPIGRSQKGVTLLDPMVSIHHARISFDLARGYIIQDLDSAKGTWVDEECIKGESRPIGVGTVLRFGDTVLEVSRPYRVPSWARIAVLASALVVALALMAFIWIVRPQRSESLPLTEPIAIHDAQFNELEPDPSVLHGLGFSLRDVGGPRITDYDYNGVSEVWLPVQAGPLAGNEVAITFERDATSTRIWHLLGVFPSPCIGHRQEDDLGVFPILTCKDQEYVVYEDADRYALNDHGGLVVLLRPPDQTDPPPPEGPAPDDEPAPSTCSSRRASRSRGSRSRTRRSSPGS